MTVLQADPLEAFKILESDGTSALVDVRSSAEWTFVGVPDLTKLGKDTIFLEWAHFPGMVQNTSFVEALSGVISEQKTKRLFFICRSGARSLHAAIAMKDAAQAGGMALDCINVAEGFEGDLDQARHRGGVSGWKARGLPWVQS